MDSLPIDQSDPIPEDQAARSSAKTATASKNLVSPKAKQFTEVGKKQLRNLGSTMEDKKEELQYLYGTFQASMSLGLVGFLLTFLAGLVARHHTAHLTYRDENIQDEKLGETLNYNRFGVTEGTLRVYALGKSENIGEDGRNGSHYAFYDEQALHFVILMRSVSPALSILCGAFVFVCLYETKKWIKFMLIFFAPGCLITGLFMASRYFITIETQDPTTEAKIRLFSYLFTFLMTMSICYIPYKCKEPQWKRVPIWTCLISISHLLVFQVVTEIYWTSSELGQFLIRVVLLIGMKFLFTGFTMLLWTPKYAKEAARFSFVMGPVIYFIVCGRCLQAVVDSPLQCLLMEAAVVWLEYKEVVALLHYRDPARTVREKIGNCRRRALGGGGNERESKVVTSVVPTSSDLVDPVSKSGEKGALRDSLQSDLDFKKKTLTRRSIKHFDRLTLDEQSTYIRQKELLFGNFVIALSVIEASLTFAPAGFAMALPLNPFKKNAPPVPRSTVLLNCLIMFVFEAFVSDYVVARKSLQLHREKGTTNIAKCWAERDRRAHFLVYVSACLMFVDVTIVTFGMLCKTDYEVTGGDIALSVCPG